MSQYDPSASAERYDANSPATPSTKSKARDATAPSLPKFPPALSDAIKVYAAKIMEARMLEAQLDAKYAEYLSVITREAELGRLKASSDTAISAWCADYTEDLTGTVATMEVPGEVNPLIGGGINIRPGYFDDAAWSAIYGQLQPATTLSEAGFAWNFTMLQPWMKWRPFWRYGTVTGKDEDNDTVDVTLQPILSKAGAWLAKQTDFNDYVGESLSAVPVVYMTCGAKIFEIGDDVVVEFRVSGGSPTPFVIGFKDNPKECPIWPEKIYIRNGQTHAYVSDIQIVPRCAGRVIVTDSYEETVDQHGRAVTYSAVYAEGSGGMPCGITEGREANITTTNFEFLLDSTTPLLFGGDNYDTATGGSFEIITDLTIPWRTETSPGSYSSIGNTAFSNRYYLINNGQYLEWESSGTIYYHSDQISPQISPPPITIEYTKDDLVLTKTYIFNRVVFQRTSLPRSVGDDQFNLIWALDSINKHPNFPIESVRMWLEYLQGAE
jgi:hypothetical protein